MANYGEMPGGAFAAYYKFEGDHNDSSGKSRTLTNTGGTFVSGVKGVIGSQCVNYAAGQYSGHTTDMLGNGSCTLSLWFKYASSSGTDSDLLTPCSASTGIFYELYYNTSRPSIHFNRYRYGIGSNGSALNPYTLSTSQWTYICAVCDVTTTNSIWLWCNTTKSIPAAVTIGNGGAGANNGIGVCNYAAGDPRGRFTIRGQVEELIIDTRPWIDAEVLRYYALTKGRMSPQVS